MVSMKTPIVIRAMQQGDGPGPLAEQDDSGGCREQGSRAPREGIDEREVPDRVSPLQEDEVPQVQHAAPEHEDERLGSEIGSLEENHDDRERRVYQHREKAEEPDEDRAPVSGALGEKVPGRVKGCRRQHQDQREHGHKVALPPDPSRGSISRITPGLLLNWRA